MWSLPTLLRVDLHVAAQLTGESRPYALFGSSVMLLHGLRDTIGDIDVFVTPAMWQTLAGRLRWQALIPGHCDPPPSDPPILETRAGGLTIHAFYEWQVRDWPAVSAADCLQGAQLVHGWWCAPLTLIRQHKAWSLAQPGADTDERQAKHRRDIAAIDAHLAAQAAA